jgi:hypothetical protein
MLASSESATKGWLNGEGSNVMIEILHVRDPDGRCIVRVWIDGVETSSELYHDIDPGRGHLAEEWEEAHREAIVDPQLSDPYRRAVDEAYTAMRLNKYVEQPRSVLLAEGGWRVNRLDDDRFVVLNPDGDWVHTVWAMGIGAQSVEAQVDWAERWWYVEGGERDVESYDATVSQWDRPDGS